MFSFFYVDNQYRIYPNNVTCFFFYLLGLTSKLYNHANLIFIDFDLTFDFGKRNNFQFVREKKFIIIVK